MSSIDFRNLRGEMTEAQQTRVTALRAKYTKHDWLFGGPTRLVVHDKPERLIVEVREDLGAREMAVRIALVREDGSLDAGRAV